MSLIIDSNFLAIKARLVFINHFRIPFILPLCIAFILLIIIIIHLLIFPL